MALERVPADIRREGMAFPNLVTRNTELTHKFVGGVARMVSFRPSVVTPP